MALWKKILLWIAGCALAFVILMVGGIIYLFDGMCSNDIYESIASPDKKLTAIIFERNCGATTGFSTQISIVPSNEDLKNEGGDVFVSDGRPEDVRPVVSWLSPSKLNITVQNNIEIYSKENSWGWPWNKVYINYN